MKIDWKRKLTSRKLWMSAAGLVVGVMLLFGASEGMAQQISGVILSLGSVTAYLVGEGLVDAASAGAAAGAEKSPAGESGQNS